MELTIEPWGMVFQVRPRGSVEILIEGPGAGTHEIERVEGRATVYGWVGCTAFAVFEDGRQLYASPIGAPSIPAVPPGYSMRRFMNGLFRG